MEWSAIIAVRVFGGNAGSLGEEDLDHLQVTVGTGVGEGGSGQWVSRRIIDDVFVYFDSAFIEHQPGECVVAVADCPMEAFALNF